MSYNSLCKTAEYFEDRARRARHPDNHERLAAVAKKYRLRAEIQRKLENAVPHERGLEDRATLTPSPAHRFTGSVALPYSVRQADHPAHH